MKTIFKLATARVANVLPPLVSLLYLTDARAYSNIVVSDEEPSAQLEPTLSTQERSNTSAKFVVTLALDIPNIVAFIVLVGMAAIGGLYIYRLATQHKCSCPLCSKQYEIVKNLGRGGFGSVLEVRRRCSSPGSAATKHRSATNRQVTGGRKGELQDSSSSSERSAFTGAVTSERFVMKLIPCGTLNDASEAQQEAKDLRFLRHPGVVTYVDDFLHAPATAALPATTNFMFRRKQQATLAAELSGSSFFVCIVMEWCPMDLHRYILVSDVETTEGFARTGICVSHCDLQAERKAKRGPMPEERLIRWAAHLLSALKYCHAKGVCHRDIKSGMTERCMPSHLCGDFTRVFVFIGNVFVTHDDDVRLGDFGLARSFAGLI